MLRYGRENMVGRTSLSVVFMSEQTMFLLHRLVIILIVNKNEITQPFLIL